jgi:SAM-dependent methyltransferase
LSSHTPLWHQDAKRMTRCPVCSHNAEMRLFLDIESIVPPHVLVTYATCPVCKSLFQLDFVTPDYSQHSFLAAALKFYVEQGAGLETLVQPAFIAGRRNKQRYMEIGCGFGFGLDFAQRVFNLEVRGIDPSQFASEGRRLLQIPIDSENFGADAAGRYGQQDTIAAMEVIEHFPDPMTFLKTLKGALAPDGILIITTPDANAITFGEAHPNLAVLTPGYHAVIFSLDSLKLALETVGFTEVQLAVRGATLFAIAGHEASKIDLDGLFDANIYRDYLEQRLKLPGSAILDIGLGSRLLKLLVNAGQYAAAEPVLSRLANAIKARDGIDIADPHKLLAQLPDSCSFAEFIQRFPACLVGILYFTGMIRLNKDGDRLAAVRYFYAAHVVAGIFRKAMFAHAIEDGETTDLDRRAAEHVRLVLGWTLE